MALACERPPLIFHPSDVRPPPAALQGFAGAALPSVPDGRMQLGPLAWDRARPEPGSGRLRRALGRA
jgi:hypothetical protein